MPDLVRVGRRRERAGAVRGAGARAGAGEGAAEARAEGRQRAPRAARLPAALRVLLAQHHAAAGPAVVWGTACTGFTDKFTTRSIYKCKVKTGTTEKRYSFIYSIVML